MPDYPDRLGVCPAALQGGGEQEGLRLTRRLPLVLATAALLAAPHAARAQQVQDAAVQSSAFEGDFLIVGVGLASIPDYEGSNERKTTLAAGVAGRIGGVGINARAAGFSLDFIPDPPGQDFAISLGPVVRYRSNRTGPAADPVVATLPRLPGVVEAGVAGSINLRHLLNAHDVLSIGSDLRWDITGHGGGMIVSPGVSYLTPLSRAQVFGLQFGFNWVNRRYAAFEYGIDAEGGAASGLPQYAGRAGIKDLSLGAFTAYDLNGDLLDGGFALAVGANYQRLQGPAAETPLTAARGRRDQWILAAGLSYTF